MTTDIRRAAASTRRYNFHSHTQFCDGRATMAEMAAAASGSGMLHWGFSPHSPLCIPSPCNMDRADVDAYIAEARRLDALYPEMNIYAGMEIDYLGESWGPATDYFKSLPLDYRIGSVHFVPTPDGGYVDVDGSPERFARTVTEIFDGDLRHVVTAFYSQTRAMLRTGGFDIVGHFDKIGLNASCFRPGVEQEQWYAEQLDETMQAVIDSGVIAEINTKARDKHGRFFPAPELWRQLHDAGVTLIVNSDAHFPDLIDASRPEAFSMLKSAGIAIPD